MLEPRWFSPVRLVRYIGRSQLQEQPPKSGRPTLVPEELEAESNRAVVELSMTRPGRRQREVRGWNATKPLGSLAGRVGGLMRYFIFSRP